MRGVRTWLAALSALVGTLQSLTAQGLSQRIDFGGGERVQYEIDYVRPGVRPSGWAYLRVDVRNDTSRVRRTDVEFSSYWSNRVGSALGAELAPGESRRLFLPIPLVGADGYYRVRTSGTQETIQSAVDSSVQYASAWSLLLVGGRLDTGSWQAASQDLFGTRVEQVRAIAAEHLPAQWWLLSGADVVVVDGASPDLDAVRQAVLDQLLRSGGSLVVLSADRLAEGALRERCLAAPSSGGAHPVGMGTLVGLGSGAAATLPAGPLDAVARAHLAGFVPRSFGGRRSGAAEHFAAPLASSALCTLEVPGLGEVPLRLFFLILLGFALVAGPWNYVYFRRRRRLPMLLVTVPALGFGVTAVILVWGLFAEGLGTKQSHRSLTVLDQVAHEATCWSQRAVYAALGPSSLRPAAGTGVAALPVLELEEGHALFWGDGNSFLGSLVPSRTVSPLATVSVTTERARLRLRRGASGDYEVLADQGVPVTDEVGSLVVRDAAGRFFGNVSSPGRVEPIDLETAKRLVAEHLDHWGYLPPDPSAASASASSLLAVEACVLRLGVGSPAADRIDDFPRGHYLVRTDRPVAHDDLGLDAEELRGAHLVFGRLGEEDFVD